LRDRIGAEIVGDVDGRLIRTVLGHCLPPQFVELYGVEAIARALPTNYLNATVAAWLAATYVYDHGLGSTDYAFHKFLRAVQAEGADDAAAPSA